MDTYKYKIYDPQQFPLTDMLSALPHWRRELALKFKFELGKRECALSYLTLCELLRENYGITTQPHFIIGEHGKPTLQEFPDIHFNMSHCKAGIAVAISDQPIGIDIECMGRYSESLARYCMSDNEMELMINAPDTDEQFTRLWTMKEALVKLTGSGIIDDVKTLLEHRQGIDIQTEVNKEKGYAISIAQYNHLTTNTYEH